MATPANRDEAAALGMSDPAIDAAGPDDLVIAVLGERRRMGSRPPRTSSTTGARAATAGSWCGPAPPAVDGARAGDVAVVSVPGGVRGAGGPQGPRCRHGRAPVHRRRPPRRRGRAEAPRPRPRPARHGPGRRDGDHRRRRARLRERRRAGADRGRRGGRHRGAGGDRPDRPGRRRREPLLRHRRARPEGRGRRDHRARRDRAAGRRTTGPTSSSASPSRRARGGRDACCARSPTAGRRRPPASAAGWTRSTASPWRRRSRTRRSPRRGWRAATAGAGARATGPVGGRRAVRGLFSGGTLCSEAAAILAERLGAVRSNAPAGRARRLEGKPSGHAASTWARRSSPAAGPTR